MPSATPLPVKALGLAGLVIVSAAALMLSLSAAKARGYVSVGIHSGPIWGSYGGHFGGWRGHDRWRHHSRWRGSHWDVHIPLYAWTPYSHRYKYYEPVIMAPVRRNYYRENGSVWPHASGAYQSRAYGEALNAPLGQAYAWREGQRQGSVTTTRDGWAGDRYCREFVQEVTIGGNRQKAHGAACRNPDGMWQIVPHNP